MSKKKLALLLSAILLVVGGGLMFHFHRMSEEEKLQAQIHKEQECMVMYAVNHYEGIEKIEFTSFGKDGDTGFWSSEAIINDEFYVTFVLRGLEGDLHMNHSPSEKSGNYLIRKNKESSADNLTGVKVIYWSV